MKFNDTAPVRDTSARSNTSIAQRANARSEPTHAAHQITRIQTIRIAGNLNASFNVMEPQHEPNK